MAGARVTPGTSPAPGRACALAMCAALVALVVAAPGVATAVAPGTNDWVWPTGTENLSTGGPWFQYRRSNRSWHLAKDIRARVGAPVYALADGYVTEAYKSLAGYRPGGAMIVVYRTADGSTFKALYGHVRNLKYKRGQIVKAGAVLAQIAPCGGFPHLHFGIHPGTARPPGPRPNLFMGHGHKALTYGWVDPGAFLRTQWPWGSTVPSSTPTPTVGSVPAPTS
jgi:murein DD-endopeptidase MepM/ murein hydrolase activator NlpD